MTLSAVMAAPGRGCINRGGVSPEATRDPVCQRKREESLGSWLVGVQSSKVPRSKIQGLTSKAINLPR